MQSWCINVRFLFLFLILISQPLFAEEIKSDKLAILWPNLLEFNCVPEPYIYTTQSAYAQFRLDQLCAIE